MSNMKKKALGIGIVAIVMMIILAFFVGLKKSKTNFKTTANITDPEMLMELTYNEVTDADKKIENCDYVEFSAYFLRDLNNDGYAEKYDGACNEIGNEDVMYVEFNVLTQGYLKDGRITLNADNYTWETSVVEDSIIKGDYIGKTSEIVLQDKVENGTQKIIWGNVSSKIGSNIHNYSRISSVTLTGTHVIENDDGSVTETDINKTVYLSVDWHGTTRTYIKNTDVSEDLSSLRGGISFNIGTVEGSEKLILQKNVVKVEIPELNKYPASSVKVSGADSYTYDEETEILTIVKESTINEDGIITSQLGRKNNYFIDIIYPQEAYESLKEESVSIKIPVTAYYYGYNNENEMFMNPYVSEASRKIVLAYQETEPKGYIWNLYDYVGKYVKKNDYRVSKEEPVKLYNGNIYEDNKDTYLVVWDVRIGSSSSINNIELKEQSSNNTIKSDTFNKDTSMYNYVKTTGVYFTNAEILGNDGWIKLYNQEENSLIETFTSANWYNYTDENPYPVNVKSIRVETSNPKSFGSFKVNQIKEIDDKLLTRDYTREEFDNFNLIYTYVTGTITAPENITYENGAKRSSLEREKFAYYTEPYSVQSLSIAPSKISSKDTENININVKTSSSNFTEKDWKNGVFLIELPTDIINLNIKNITISNPNVQIKNYYQYYEDEKYFIKIYTENEEVDIFTININADVTANPLIVSNNTNVKLYSYNENCDNYKSNTKDIYDVDSDGNVEDLIGYNNAGLSITNVNSAGLITTEYVTDYDDNGNITVAPRVADVNKSSQARTATINVQILNNYTGKLSEILILGKIPYEGNNYVINGRELGSEFTAILTGPITVPEALQATTTVYYSEKENTNSDIADNTNEWKLATEVGDWSKIRTYCIDLGDYELSKSEKEIFSYEVKIPGGLKLNSVSFSHHAVFYYLNTRNGKLAMYTEPNKVGIQIVEKYNLRIAKNRKGMDTIAVNNATYKVETTDVDGNKISKIATTDREGVLTFKDLYIGKEYTLTEVSVGSDYELSTEEIKFNTNVNTNGQLEFNVESGSFKNTPEVTTDSNDNHLVKASLEDEVKYTLKINKKDEAGNALSDVTFSIKGKGITKFVKTDSNGEIILKGLYINEEYELLEVKADGYYLNPNAKKFKIIRNNSGELEMQTTDTELNNARITEKAEVIQAEVTVTLKNEKIPKYNLQIIKVKENPKEENIDNLIKIENAHFAIQSEYTGETQEYTTDSNGIIQIPDLYLHTYKDYVVGEYVIRETKAPEQYAINGEEVRLAVKQDSEGSLEATVLNADELETYRSVSVDGNTVKLVLQNKALFQLKKVDSETGEPLKNAEFIIYEIDENGKELDYAKDGSGNYVGTKNSNGDYTVFTDENGEIPLSLVAGLYKAVEITYPDGYMELGTEEIFRIAGKNDEEKQEEQPEEAQEDNNESNLTVLEIDSIDDLVKLSDNVNSGRNYANYLVKLTKDLDVTDDSCYEDSTLKSSILSEGFKPIGYGTAFSGIFDGQGHKININVITDREYAALFGYIENATIRNLELNGECSSSSNDARVGGIVAYSTGSNNIKNCISNVRRSYRGNSSFYTGGIVAYCAGKNTNISNCVNKVNMSTGGTGTIYNGGIVGYNSSELTITDCSNEGSFSDNNGANTAIGGIVAYSSSSSLNINNCQNTGNINVYTMGDYSYIAGIVGYGSNLDIKNTNNSANYIRVYSHSPYVGGIVGYGSCNITDCYNISEINNTIYAEHAGSGYGYTGGIIGNSDSADINNCYNTGNITANGVPERLYTAGIIGRNNRGTISNCNNAGDIINNGARGSDIGGICGRQTGNITTCYNTGNIRTNQNNVDGYTSIYQGGISGNATVSNCYNTGIITVETKTNYTVNGEVGGITGVGSAKECYNIANINCSVNSDSDSTIYVGGIAGNGSATNCYNTADITNICKARYMATSYVGGISGGSSATNCYNIGNVYNNKTSGGTSTYIHTGGITGGVNATNSYYLNILQILGGSMSKAGTAVSEEEMKSKEIYQLLNVDDVWSYRRFNYPVLVKGVSDDLKPSTEITIKNTQKKYRITTEVEGRVGGNISGAYSDPYETVVYKENNQKEIVMTPSTGYSIIKITINGKELDISSIGEGETYTIPAEYFKEMTEDKHIVVTYALTSQTLKIIKQDSVDNSILLEGATFKVQKQGTEESIEATTNSCGEIRTEVEAGTYKITEIKAPEGYILDPTEYTVNVGPGRTNSIILKNKKQTGLIVHHYLKDNGVYTTEKVADDQVYKGNVNEEYTTSPHIDLEGLTLEKDSNGKYVVPSNATGHYTEEGIVVIYYYEAKPIELVINHYIEGTETKLADEAIKETEPTIITDGEGNYTISAEDEYVVKTNNDYNNLILSDYVLTRVESTIKDQTAIDDTLEYNKNEELIYYYKLKQQTITTEVIEHTETIMNEYYREIEEVVKGGTITGEYNANYPEEDAIQYVETVDRKADSTVSITATPDAGYIVGTIKLISTNENGTKTERIIYGENAQTAEITANVNQNGSVTLTTFTNVLEDKHIQVDFTPINYNFDVDLKDTKDNILEENKFVVTKLTKSTDETTSIVDNKSIADYIESQEIRTPADTYIYKIEEIEAPNDVYVNVLEGKYVEVTTKVSEDGSINITSWEIYKDGTVVDATDPVRDYVTVELVTANVEYPTIHVVIQNPVTFTVELEKVNEDGTPLQNTGVTIESSIIEEQEAIHSEEIEKEAVTNISTDGVVTGKTNSDGVVKYDETWVDANNSKEFYTYKIRETAPSGNQYVNVLNGYVIVVRVHVDSNGTITLVDENGNAYDAAETIKYTIQTDDNEGKVIDKSSSLYGYVSVAINKNAINATIDTKGTMNVDIINPVKYQVDIITKDTLDKFLSGTNVVAYRESGNEKILVYNGEATDISKTSTAEKLEMPMDAGTYVYYFTQTGRKDESYVNVLDGKFIKVAITVGADGTVTVNKAELYKGNIGDENAILIPNGQGSVFKYFDVKAVAGNDIYTLQVTIINPVSFIVEVDTIDSEEHPLGKTGIEIESEIIKQQNGEFNNEAISGIEDITNKGIVTGNTSKVINGETKYATVSYEETWVDANKESNPYYTHIIKETKKAGNQYINILDGYQIVIKTKVGADGRLTLVDENGYTIEAVDGSTIPQDVYEKLSTYVSVVVNNGVVKAILNTQIENPVRYNVAIHANIYGKEQIELAGMPVQVAGFSPKTTLVTGQNGSVQMEEAPVRADNYKYMITPLSEYINSAGYTVELGDEFVNIFEGYYIGIDLRVHGDGSIKTIGKNGNETTDDYKLFKRNARGEFEEIEFSETIVDEFVKVNITKDNDIQSEDYNVCTLNVYIQIPEKYNFKLIKTDIDTNERLNGVEFSIVARDSNGNIALKNAESGVNAKSSFDVINTSKLKTESIVKNGEVEEDGIIEFNSILIEKAGTYTFEITEVTPTANGFIYKDKSEPVIVKVEIAIENGKYIIKNMSTIQASRYTIPENTKITGTETQTVNVNILNERIKGSYNLITDTINKYTEQLLDGGIYKITVIDENGNEKELYLADGNITSHNPVLPYEGDVNGNIEGTSILEIDNIRIDLPGTYTIKIEELKSPDGFIKLDDPIEIAVTVGIKGEYDNAEYVVKAAELKEGNHGLITVTYSEHEINVIVRKEFFDLALRQYISSISGKEIEGRKPSIDLEDLNSLKSTTATYIQKKEAQTAYAGNEVIYTIEVYNEGLIDGYAEEIVEHLPDGLEFVDDEFNNNFGWKYYPDENKVVTTILSKENGSVGNTENSNLIKAYNKSANKISSKTIQLKLKVSSSAKLHDKLTAIAEITKVLVDNRKQTLERDSKSLVVVPKGKELANYKDDQLGKSYIKGDEDDDDFEKLIIEEFDLATVKYIKQVNDKVLENAEPKLSLNEDLIEQYEDGIYSSFKYKVDKEIEKVKQNDRVVYGIRIYNEGSVPAYATEVVDTLPNGLVLANDSEINSKYGWYMVDSNGEVTENSKEAVCVASRYLSSSNNSEKESNLINALTIKDGEIIADYRELEIEFNVVEPDSVDRVIENVANVSKYDNDLGITLVDIDPEELLPENREKIYVRSFDLELTQEINHIVIEDSNGKCIAENSLKGENDQRKIAKVDIPKNKLDGSTMKVEYIITIKNNGETSGYATEITDYVPEGFVFSKVDNPIWTEINGKLKTNALSDVLLKPGDVRQLKLVLIWNGSNNLGSKENIAEISKHADENKLEVVDIDSIPNNLIPEEDDQDSTVVLIAIRTGGLKIASIIVVILCFLLAIVLGYKYYRDNRK